jgi:hypothetical protein
MFKGLPDPDLLVRGTDPGLDPAPNPSFSHKGVDRIEIMLAKKDFNTKLFSKKFNFKTED